MILFHLVLQRVALLGYFKDFLLLSFNDAGLRQFINVPLGLHMVHSKANAKGDEKQRGAQVRGCPYFKLGWCHG